MRQAQTETSYSFWFVSVCLKLGRAGGTIGRGPKAAGYLRPAGGPVRFAPMSKGIDELARIHAEAAMDTLASVLDPDNWEETKDRIAAAREILDRGYGKPSQAIIQVPAGRQQAALLASMSDEQLVAVIESKQLPRLGAPQPLITIEPRTPSIGAAVKRASAHGPADFYDDAPLATAKAPAKDPLLL